MKKTDSYLPFDKKLSLLTDDFNKLSAVLFEDAKTIADLLKIEDNQTLRRLYVKSLVSAIDSQVSYLKAHIILTGEVDYLGLNAEQEKILYRKDQKKNLSFIQDLVFAFETFSYVNYSFLTIDKKSKAYNYLFRLVKVRNRITHPSKFDDLVINDRDIKICESAFNAFQHSLYTMMKVSTDALLKQIEPLKKHLKTLNGG